MQLHALEAGLLRAPRGGGEPAGDLPDLFPRKVLDRLPVAVEEVVAEARALHVALQAGLELGIAHVEDALGERAAAHGVLHEDPRGLPSGDLEKVDDLGDDDRGGDGAHLLAQGLQARNEPFVREPQERAAGHVPDAGGFEHDHARAAERVAQIDLPHGRGHEAVLGAAPRDHGR